MMYFEAEKTSEFPGKVLVNEDHFQQLIKQNDDLLKAAGKVFEGNGCSAKKCVNCETRTCNCKELGTMVARLEPGHDGRR